MDHYRVLGLSMSASATAIRTAYRRLARALHPDRAGEQSKEAFQKIALAYEVLSDPVKRARYDDRLARGVAGRTRSSQSTARHKRDVLPRISGALRTLVAAGLVSRISGDLYRIHLTREEANGGGFIVISTSPPNQLTHWFTVPPGTITGDTFLSVVRASDSRSVLELKALVL